MLYRPSLRSIWTLIILSAICISLYAWSERSRVQHRLPYYSEKIAAAKLMDRALQVLEDTTTAPGTVGDTYQDPRLIPVIGQQFSLITTDYDIFEAKLASANPNFAAAMVDLLKQAKVRGGDLVAVGMTGSYPGANLALLCACEAIGAVAVTITAVGSTWWGANDPEFTWLDMERVLNAQGVLHSRPIAASLGGSRDEAFGLSNVGQDLLRTAIARNGLVLVRESDVSASVARRMELYARAAGGRRYAAYVAVGSGEADLGHPSNSRLIGDGYIDRLPLRNYPARGVVHLFNSQGVEIINISHPMVISQGYGLGGAEVPLADVGQGGVYTGERYDLRVAGFSAVVALLLIVTLVRLDSKIFRLREAGVDPDTLM